MKNYFGRLLLGLIVLSGCTTYQRKPIIFISDSKISFQSTEDSIQNKCKLIGNFAFSSNGDSFPVGMAYKSVEFKTNYWHSTHFNCYIVTHQKEPIADIVTLDFYKKKLFRVSMYAKGKSNIDSLIKVTEKFYNKKFDNASYSGGSAGYDSMTYANFIGDWPNKRSYFDSATYANFRIEWTNKSSYFRKGRIGVSYYHDVVYDEITLNITNNKVKVPSWCGFRTPLWWYLTFWRHW